MALRKRWWAENSMRKLQIALCGELVWEEDLDLS